MAKTYNLTSRFNTERPTIVIGEKAYEVDDRQSTFLKLNELLKNDSTDFKAIYELIFGKKNGDEIYNLDLSVSDTEVLLFGIFAAIKGVSLEEAEESFRSAAK